MIIIVVISLITIIIIIIAIYNNNNNNDNTLKGLAEALAQKLQSSPHGFMIACTPSCLELFAHLFPVLVIWP